MTDCPCGDNDGLACSLSGCPYPNTFHAPGLAQEVADLTALLDNLEAPTTSGAIDVQVGGLVESEFKLSLAGRVAALVARIKAVKS